MSDRQCFGGAPVVAWTPWVVTGPLLQVIVHSYAVGELQPRVVIVQPDDLAFLRWIKHDGEKLGLIHPDGIWRTHWALPGGELAGIQLFYAWKRAQLVDVEHVLTDGKVIAFTFVESAQGSGIEWEHYALSTTDGRLTLRDPITWTSAA